MVGLVLFLGSQTFPYSSWRLMMPWTNAFVREESSQELCVWATRANVNHGYATKCVWATRANVNHGYATKAHQKHHCQRTSVQSFLCPQWALKANGRNNVAPKANVTQGWASKANEKHDWATRANINQIWNPKTCDQVQKQNIFSFKTNKSYFFLSLIAWIEAWTFMFGI